MNDAAQPLLERTDDRDRELLAHHGGPNRGPRTLLAISLLATIAWIVAVVLLEHHDKESGEVEAFRHWSWLVVVVILVIFMIGVGHHVTGHWRGLIIDDRHKISLSRIQLALWTILVLSAFANALVWHMVQDVCQPGQDNLQTFSTETEIGSREAGSQVDHNSCTPLELAMPVDLLLLMGVSTGALIGANVVKSDQLRKGKLHTNAQHSDADWTDIFKAEGNDDVSELDLGKIQMLLFTVVLVAGYAGVVLMEFARSDRFEFPVLSVATVGLLGISQIGYLATKAAQN